MKTDSYRGDKNKVVKWVAGAIGSGLVLLGTWQTNETFTIKSDIRLHYATIMANELQSRERDKTIADTTAVWAAQMQLQLTQIQTQLAEIQRDLRHGARP